jgi:hypothetical protein
MASQHIAGAAVYAVQFKKLGVCVLPAEPVSSKLFPVIINTKHLFI